MPYPAKRSPELIENILMRVANGETLSQACRANDVTPMSFGRWKEQDETLAAAHAHAMEIGFDAMADQMLAIVDAEPATVIDTAGNRRIDPAYVALAKARSETRGKLLAKWSPRYADNRLELTGRDGGAIELNTNNSAVTELVSLIRAAKRGPAIEQASAPAALPDDSAPDA